MRGKAEGHMGELMDVLAPARSSAPVRRATTEAVAQPEELGVRAQNETLLLLGRLHALAC